MFSHNTEFPIIKEGRRACETLSRIRGVGPAVNAISSVEVKSLEKVTSAYHFPPFKDIASLAGTCSLRTAVAIRDARAFDAIPVHHHIGRSSTITAVVDLRAVASESAGRTAVAINHKFLELILITFEDRKHLVVNG